MSKKDNKCGNNDGDNMANNNIIDDTIIRNNSDKDNHTHAGFKKLHLTKNHFLNILMQLTIIRCLQKVRNCIFLLIVIVLINSINIFKFSHA